MDKKVDGNKLTKLLHKFVVPLYIFSQFNSQSGRPPASIESFPVIWALIGRGEIGQLILLANVTVTILCDDCKETLHILY